MIPYCILAIEDESDRAFMTELFLQYHRLMYQKIFQIVHNSWIAEDLMQATLESLIIKVQELRAKDRSHLVNYIITACRNRSMTYLREQQRHPSVQFDETWDGEDTEHNRQAIEHHLASEEDIAILVRIWPKLDARSRWVLEGHYIYEKSPLELSKELGIKPSSFRMILSRARKNAYALLEEELNTEK